MSSSRARFRVESATKRSLWLLAALGIMGLSGCGTTSTGQSTPAAPVEIHISLDQTRVVGGTSIKGQASLTNTTSKTILVQQCAADGWLQVGLMNRRIPFDPAMPLIACPSVDPTPPRSQSVPNRSGDDLSGVLRSRWPINDVCPAMRPCQWASPASPRYLQDESRDLRASGQNTNSSPDQDHGDPVSDDPRVVTCSGLGKVEVGTNLSYPHAGQRYSAHPAFLDTLAALTWRGRR